MFRSLKAKSNKEMRSSIKSQCCKTKQTHTCVSVNKKIYRFKQTNKCLQIFLSLRTYGEFVSQILKKRSYFPCQWYPHQYNDSFSTSLYCSVSYFGIMANCKSVILTNYLYLSWKRFPIGKVLMFGFISCGGLIFYSQTKNIPVGVFTLTQQQHITRKTDLQGFSVQFQLNV